MIVMSMELIKTYMWSFLVCYEVDQKNKQNREKHTFVIKKP